MKTLELIDKQIVVLLSGGPDSAVAAYFYHNKGYKIHCLTLVNNERGSNCIEVECAKLIAAKIKAPHTVVNFSCITEVFRDISNMKFAVGGDAGGCSPPRMITAPLSIEIMHMVSMMYAVAHSIKTIAWSIHLDDLETESIAKTQEYLSVVAKLVHLQTGQSCKIETPFLTMSKSKVLLLGDTLSVPFRQTFSCSKNEENVHCGRCSQCIKRNNAFKKAGMLDPTHCSTCSMILVS